MEYWTSWGKISISMTHARNKAWNKWFLRWIIYWSEGINKRNWKFWYVINSKIYLPIWNLFEELYVNWDKREHDLLREVRHKWRGGVSSFINICVLALESKIWVRLMVMEREKNMDSFVMRIFSSLAHQQDETAEDLWSFLKNENWSKHKVAGKGIWGNQSYPDICLDKKWRESMSHPCNEEIMTLLKEEGNNLSSRWVALIGNKKDLGQILDNQENGANRAISWEGNGAIGIQ